MGLAARLKIPDNENIYISYWVKYSDNWVGANVKYIQHEFSLVTNKDWEYVGPASTNLTLYIEQNRGKPQLAI